MTRPSRQAVATAALLALTVVPTAYVVWTAWAIRRPAHRRDVAAELGRRLGLHVALDSVQYPRPCEAIYRGVVFRQNEPLGKGFSEVARADTVWLRRGEQELSLQANGLRLRAENPSAGMAQVVALLERSGEAFYERVSLTAPVCQIDFGAGIAPYEIRDLVGQFAADRDAPNLRASYQVVSEGSTTRCEMTLSRDRKAGPLRTTLAFNTMEGPPLPARVLDPFFDSAGWLGREAKVEGALTLHQEAAKDWEAEFQGNLFEIDLAELVDRRFPMHKLRGKAHLAVSRARWAERPAQGCGWVEAKGELSAGPGVIGFGLLQALRTEMNFRPAPRVARVVSGGAGAGGQVDLEFRAMALRFAMTPDGEIQIDGGLGNEFSEDLVLAGPVYPIAFAPEGAANVRGLIKTLFPITSINHGVMVPLTEKSRLLLCLPVPPDVASKPMGGN